MSKLTVFQTEEQFNKIYEKCLATMPQATKAIETSYHGMDDMFNDYIEALEEHTFRHAYQCGYEAAMAEINNGGVA